MIRKIEIALGLVIIAIINIFGHFLAEHIILTTTETIEPIIKWLLFATPGMTTLAMTIIYMEAKLRQTRHICELDGIKAFPTSANKGKKVLKKPSKQ